MYQRSGIQENSQQKLVSRVHLYGVGEGVQYLGRGWLEECSIIVMLGLCVWEGGLSLLGLLRYERQQEF